MTKTELRDMREERFIQPRPPLPRRDEEHIDIMGHLRVPHEHASDKAEHREGWEPFWVNVNLSDPTQKVVSYKKIDS